MHLHGNTTKFHNDGRCFKEFGPRLSNSEGSILVEQYTVVYEK